MTTKRPFHRALCALVAAVMLLACLPTLALAADTGSDSNVYEYHFTSPEALADFTPYFLDYTGYWDHMVGVEETLDQHWSFATEDGITMLRRSGLAAANPGTGDNNAMLYLTARKFKYFDAEMTFKFGDSWGWAQLCFGAANPGNHMHNDNAGVYMQQEGHVNLSCPGGNDQQVDADSGFVKAGLHTLRLKVTEGAEENSFHLTIWADGVQKIDKDVKADNFSDRDGYISLHGQNDNVSFVSLKITDLDVDNTETTEATEATEPGASTEYEYGFDSPEALADFTPYFLDYTGYWDHMVGVEEALDQHWSFVTEGDTTMLRRSGLAAANPGTSDNNAMLYLTARKFKYFDAEMTFKFGDSWGWAQLCFGAENPGSHMHNDNAGVYMQQEGHVNLSCPGGNDQQVDAGSDFVKAGQHTLRLKVTEGAEENSFHLTIWADGVQKIDKDVKADNFSDRDGYISLQAQNDNVSFVSLKITDLDVPEAPVESEDATCKVLYQIRLIEPWGLRINVRFTDGTAAANTLDYSKFTDWGAYAVRRSQLDDPTADIATLTYEDIRDNASAFAYSKADDTMTWSGNYLSFVFDDGLFTYRLSEDIVWAAYYVDENGTHFTPVNERNLSELMNERKDSPSSTYSAYEKAVYAAMCELEDSITDYRSDFPNVSDMPQQNTGTMASTNIGFGTAAADDAFLFARIQQIGLIEPWGMRLNTRIYEQAQAGISNAHTDYSALDDYGLIVFHDKDGVIANAADMDSYDELLNYSDKENVYVFSQSQGTMEESGVYAASIYNKDIYTYQLDSTMYYVFFAKSGDNFYYSQLYAQNIRTLAADRAESSSTAYTAKEKAVYADMVALCDAITAYREDYFSHS